MVALRTQGNLINRIYIIKVQGLGRGVSKPPSFQPFIFELMLVLAADGAANPCCNRVQIAQCRQGWTNQKSA